MSRGRPGAVLLEVIISLTILAVAGTAAVVAAGEGVRAVDRVRSADLRIREASAFLEAVALWPRDDLDRHLGDRIQGPWRMRVDRPMPTLYTIVLTDSLGGAELLRTSLYRPEPGREEP